MFSARFWKDEPGVSGQGGTDPPRALTVTRLEEVGDLPSSRVAGIGLPSSTSSVSCYPLLLIGLPWAQCAGSPPCLKAGRTPVLSSSSRSKLRERARSHPVLGRSPFPFGRWSGRPAHVFVVHL